MFYLLKNKCQLHMVGKNVKIRCGKKQEKSKVIMLINTVQMFMVTQCITVVMVKLEHGLADRSILKPKSKGGSNELKNLPALNSKKNISLGNKTKGKKCNK